MIQATLGLKANWQQFTLLVIVNGFVGGMVGLERSILPELAESEFGLAAKTAILSFIVVFGVTKALTNYLTGSLANRLGRKKLLSIGWLFALPVPLLLIYAPNWSWVIFANVLLGINQGLTWSSTVVMKIDLVGPQNRGLAMGINESVGYLAVGLVAFLSAWLAAEYGIRPVPFYLGLGFAVIGLLASVFLVKDTRGHVASETRDSKVPRLQHVFRDTTFRHPNLSSITQAGLVNNLNDGMIWGLFPMLLAAKGFTLEETGKLVAIYPLVWGLGQLITGKMADHYAKKYLLFFGMLLQGLVIVALVFAQSFTAYSMLGILLGVGTAVVYPTFLAAIADDTHPRDRAASIGVFRLWRDLGYAIGALLTGMLADLWSSETAVLAIGLITLFSSGIIALRMRK